MAAATRSVKKPILRAFLPLACLSCVLWVVSCTVGSTPMPTVLPTATQPTATADATVPPPSVTPTLTATGTPGPTRTPAPRPTARGGKDALEIAYFPWADPSGELFPVDPKRATGKVVNSIFFADPPFFGFDLQTEARWYHVTGTDHLALVDGERISPTINRQRRPRDGDTVVVYGQLHEQFITASYVGFTDGTPWFYRSLLSADELGSPNLPPAYAGLDVWVRDVLDSAERWRKLYRLPGGEQPDIRYAGQAALVAGRLLAGAVRTVEVKEGVYISSEGHYANLLHPQPTETPSLTRERGVVRGVGLGGLLVVAQRADASLVEVTVNEDTRIEFADGSRADLSEIVTERRIEAVGRTAAANQLSATQIIVLSTVSSGQARAAYIAGVDGDLWTVGLDGSNRRQITHLKAFAAAPGLAQAAISPDGLQFVFARRWSGESTLVLGDMQTGELRELLNADKWQETDPAWSPEGSRVVFCRHRVTDGHDVDGGLWLLHVQKGIVRQLTGPVEEGWLTAGPRWSPDGKRIAYGQAGGGAVSTASLHVLALPSDSRWVLEYALEWRWSVDSAQLLCTRQAPDEKRTRLWVVQRDASSPTWLSPADVHDHEGRWSPDGTAIAFLSHPEGSSRGDSLWIMTADGTHRQRLTDVQLPANQLAWAPDSQAIVFMKGWAAVNDGLKVMGRDGLGLRELAADAASLVAIYSAP